MKLAFCLYRYFPFGGLQRDFFRIAEVCLKNGHQIVVYTSDWQGPKHANFVIKTLAVKGFQNHRRFQSFVSKAALEIQKDEPDCVIGFNKMPNLDIYYAADVCFKDRMQKNGGEWKKILPRYRYWCQKERQVFEKNKKTQIFLIAPKQQALFTKHYQTEADRFHLLRPGIQRMTVSLEHQQRLRLAVRKQFQLEKDDYCLLLAGSSFKTKGLDRAIKAMHALPESIKKRTQFLVLGQDNPNVYKKLAKRYHLNSRIHFLGGQSQVTPFYFASDLLLHPAYHENTGTVLLEALTAGLPVLASDVCGYAPYIQKAGAGKLIPSPFSQTIFNQILLDMLISKDRLKWSQNGLNFGKETDLYRLPDQARALIEAIGMKR